jgi:hypothetical protein
LQGQNLLCCLFTLSPKEMAAGAGVDPT